MSSSIFGWKIKVKVIIIWKGATKTGDEFKGFNILLLDNKVSNYYILDDYFHT